MYKPVPTTTTADNEEKKDTCVAVVLTHRLFWQMLMLLLLGVVLAVTYDRCLTCVWCVAVLSLLTLNCIPGMPIIFLMSAAVLLLHAIDYNRATIKVEIPLGDLIPSYDTVRPYVHVMPPTADTTTTQERQGLLLGHNR